MTAFLREYESAIGTDPASTAAAKARVAGKWASEKPAEMYAELRGNHPIFVTPLFTFVTRYDDVIEVLERHDVFSVRVNDKKMQPLVGAFILGTDDGPESERAVSLLRLAVRREDLPRIQDFLRQSVQECISEVASTGRMELISALSRRVPARFVGHYFGVPGPDEATLMRWARTLFHDIFINLQNIPEIHQAAATSAKEMGAYIDALIAERRKQAGGVGAKDDVLGRMLQMQSAPPTHLDDSRVRDNLVGSITGVIETTSKAIANLLDELLRRPEALAAAQKAAREDDDETLRAYIYEALRLKPQNTALVRFCERPYTLARGTARETNIPRGAVLFAANASAMMDPDHVEAPHEFRINRPADNHLHFGYGMHACLGRYISPLQIHEVCKGVLRLNGLRRAAGTDGELRYAGPFPETFTLEFDA